MTAINIQPGDDLHLTSLMAPHSLNLVTGQDRAALLAYGRDVFAAARTGAAPAAVAGPANDLAELAMLNKLIELGAKASYAHAKSNSDDGPAGTAAYVQWQELRAEMGELIRAHKAPALEAPAAPATPAQVQALHRARRALYAIGKTYDDSELRTRALETDEEIDRMLAAAPQAPTAPAEAMPYLEARLKDYKCQRVDDAGGTPGLTLYMTKLGAHPEYQLYLDEAMALWINIGRALDQPVGAAPAAPAVDASDDKALLDFLRDTSCDLRSIDVPTGGDDSDVHWRVIEHYMSEPREREIGRSWSDDPREAIRAAIAAQAAAKGSGDA